MQKRKYLLYASTLEDAHYLWKGKKYIIKRRFYSIAKIYDKKFAHDISLKL